MRGFTNNDIALTRSGVKVERRVGRLYQRRKDKEMKARLVTDIRAPDAKPGDIELRKYPDGQVGGYAYRCPWCGHEDYLPVDDGERGWALTGQEDAPTLQPSILHRPCGWHGYLTNGEFAPC